MTSPFPWGRKILPLLFGLLLGLVGCLVNIHLPVRGPFGLDFVVGSAIAYFYLQFDRQSLGPYLTIGVIAISTWVLWGHPYAGVIMVAEFLAVGLFMRRLSALAIISLFWMSIGPLMVGAFYGQLLHMAPEIWFIVSIKQGMNGILSVAAGTFVATFLRLTVNNKSFIKPISVVGFATSGVLPFVLIPTILITFDNARRQSQTELALHAVAWSQFADDFGEATMSAKWQDSQGLVRAMREQSERRPDVDQFTPIRLEFINPTGEVVSACLPHCPSEQGFNEEGGETLPVPGLINTRLFLPARASLMQRWRDGSLTTLLPAEDARPALRATTSLRTMVDRSFLGIRQDFYVLIAAVSIILAVGVILYNRVVTPFRRMGEALDDWHSYDFSVPELPEQKFVEIDRFRLLIERVSRSLAGERDRSTELQQQINTIAQQSPMIFASWLVERRYGQPMLDFISARPEERLMVGAELFSKPVKALSRVHPEDRAAVRAALANLVAHRHAGAEIRIMGTDGQWRWILCRVSSRRTAAGLNEAIGVFTDITELNSMRELLGQTNGITLVGRMVAGLAHEINQPLNVISMAADNLLHYLTKHADALGPQLPYLHDKSEKILQQVRRAGTLLSTVEGLANQGTMLEGRHELRDLINESIKTVAGLAAQTGIEITSRLPEGSLAIRGNEQALVDCFAAMLRNGIEAIDGTAGHGGGAAKGQGRITVTASHFSKIRRVKIEISDNGPGIDPEILPFLFSPFQSIKATAEGSGLSLARCFAVIQSCGGEVYARNAGEGAVITIYLPLA